MNFISENYHVDIEHVQALITAYGSMGAASILSEGMDDNIDNTYAAGVLYAEYLRNTSMDEKDLLHTYPTLFNKEVREFILSNYDELNSYLKHERDYGYKFTSVKDIASNYLFKVEGKPVECIQWMWMRIAAQVSMPQKKGSFVSGSVQEVKDTYDILSQREGIHATPTCVNAGFHIPQLESCFVVPVGDSMLSIADAYKLVAMGSKCNGGFGIDVGRIRHSRVANRGQTKGTIGVLKLFNSLVPYADQLGSRPAAITAHEPVWHMDIRTFIHMKDRNAPLDIQCTNLNYCVSIPDLFRKRCLYDENNPLHIDDPYMNKGMWSLFCPRETQILWAKLHNVDHTNSKEVDKCPSLHDVWGDEFESFYLQCEKAGIARDTVKAVDLDREIHVMRGSIGEPFIFNVDSVNRKSNHKHLGTITQSNLCVHGDTPILTDQGYIPIRDVADREVNVWNGEEWSKVTPMKTGENQKLYSIHFENDIQIVCTGYHKFYIIGGDEPVAAKDLKYGMQLIPYKLPGKAGTKAIQIDISSGDNDMYLEMSKDVSNPLDITLDGSITEMKSLKFEGRYFHSVGDTYCFTEPKRHMGIFGGVITGQCQEITQYTKPGDVCATCDLATINLAAFAKDGKMDYTRLGQVTRQLVRNLNRVIDRTSGILPNEGQKALDEYLREHPEDRENPIFKKMLETVEKDPTYTGRMRNRAIGVGGMGLASMLSLLGLEYGSKEAMDVATITRACIYWHSMDESANLAAVEGVYATFEGSPVSKGILAPDMWMEEDEFMESYTKNLGMKDMKRHAFPIVDPMSFGVSVDGGWQYLRDKCKRGVRNSLVTCQMPNVTTSSVFGVSASIEPFYEIMFTSSNINGTDKNIYDAFRDVLIMKGIYEPVRMAKFLKEKYGRVEGMHTLFEDEKKRIMCKEVEKLFTNSFSVNKKKYILMVQKMGRYIDQATSLNIFYDKPNADYLSQLSMLAWLNGNKTEYYLRRLASEEKITTTVGKKKVKEEEIKACRRDNPDCIACQ